MILCFERYTLMMKKKYILTLSLCLCFAFTVIAIAKPPAGSINITVGKDTRSYLIHLPTDFDKTKRYPLVLAFHGGGGNGEQFMKASRWNDKSDEAGFIVVYPNGTGRFARMLTWNVETCCGYAQKKNVDDVTFINALLDDLIKQYPIDAKRVYATGMSNGAMISYRLACELSHRITAIAPVSGTLMTDIPQNAHKVPVLHIHGTADQNVLFAGGVGPNSIVKVNFTSVQKTIETWVKHNAANPKPVITNMPDTSDDGMTSTRTVYVSDNAPVELITIANGGHSWPGTPNPRLKQLGSITMDFHAEDVIWDFFCRFTLP
jgi:polyhydroxybutyrate depolymerase